MISNIGILPRRCQTDFYWKIISWTFFSSSFSFSHTYSLSLSFFLLFRFHFIFFLACRLLLLKAHTTAVWTEKWIYEANGIFSKQRFIEHDEMTNDDRFRKRLNAGKARLGWSSSQRFDSNRLHWIFVIFRAYLILFWTVECRPFLAYVHRFECQMSISWDNCSA